VFFNSEAEAVDALLTRIGELRGWSVMCPTGRPPEGQPLDPASEWQKLIDELRVLWCAGLPKRCLPPWPKVASLRDAQDALDFLQSQLEGLGILPGQTAPAGGEPPASRVEASSDAATPTSIVVSATPPDGAGEGRRAPGAVSRWESLRGLIGSLKLKGNERAVVEAICDGDGSASVEDLGVELEWMNPDDNCNSTLKRLKPKLKRHGWQLYRHDGSARAEQIPNKTIRTSRE